MEILKDYKQVLTRLLNNEDFIKYAFNNVRIYYNNVLNSDEYKQKELERLDKLKEDNLNHAKEIVEDRLKNFNKYYKARYEETFIEEENIIELLNTKEYKEAIEEFINGKELTQDFLLYLIIYPYFFDNLVNNAYYNMAFIDENHFNYVKQYPFIEVKQYKSLLNFLPYNEEIKNYILDNLYKKLTNRWLNCYHYWQEETLRYKYPSNLVLYNDPKLDHYVKEGKLNYYDILVLSNVIEVFYKKDNKFSLWQLTTLLNGKNTGKNYTTKLITLNSLFRLLDLHLIYFDVDNKDNINIIRVNLKPSIKFTEIERKELVSNKNKEIRGNYREKNIEIYFFSKYELLKKLNYDEKNKRIKDKKHNVYIDVKEVYKMLNHTTPNLWLKDRQTIEKLIKKYANKYEVKFSKNIHAKGKEEGIIDYSHKKNEILGYWLKVLS